MRIRAPRRLSDADTITLIYELLDAHQDTAELAEGLCDDPEWAAHLDYLRALQRVGRETLARLPDRTRGDRDERDEARR